MYKIVLSKKAVKDTQKIAQAGLKPKVKRILEILEKDPFQSPPFYEKLVGNLSGFIQDGLIFSIDWCTKFSRRKKLSGF